jgi:predicted house-cleaning NTP pyrophosphatase (Maf/HAM1 superfamily)
MYRYAGHHEIRFKITDQEAKLFQDTANYFYEKHILQKPNIQELARWCIKQTVNASQDLVTQAKLRRQQQLQQQIKQQQMWQKQLNNNPPSLGYNL